MRWWRHAAPAFRCNRVGVFVMPVPLGVSAFDAVGGNGVHAPVDEYSELGVLPPGRDLASIDPCPVRRHLIFWRQLGRRQRAVEKNDEAANSNTLHAGNVPVTRIVSDISYASEHL